MCALVVVESFAIEEATEFAIGCFGASPERSVAESCAVVYCAIESCGSVAVVLFAWVANGHEPTVAIVPSDVESFVAQFVGRFAVVPLVSAAESSVSNVVALSVVARSV